MTISVIMSVYRNERPEYLDESIRSIWTDQTVKPAEIILIKDGPLTDALERTISTWKERIGDRLITHSNGTNLGLTKSLNIALRLASSDLIARMDSDDLSDSRRFERQTAFLEANPDVAIVGGAMQEFNSSNPKLNVRHYPRNNDEVMRTIYKASPLAHPTVMMRSAIFRNGLKYDERYRTSQDIALWFDAICAGYKIGNIDDITLYFRRDDEMFRRRSRAKAWNEFRIYMNGVRRVYGLLTPKYVFKPACFQAHASARGEIHLRQQDKALRGGQEHERRAIRHSYCAPFACSPHRLSGSPAVFRHVFHNRLTPVPPRLSVRTLPSIRPDTHLNGFLSDTNHSTNRLIPSCSDTCGL